MEIVWRIPTRLSYDPTFVLSRSLSSFPEAPSFIGFKRIQLVSSGVFSPEMWSKSLKMLAPFLSFLFPEAPYSSLQQRNESVLGSLFRQMRPSNNTCETKQLKTRVRFILAAVHLQCTQQGRLPAALEQSSLPRYSPKASLEMLSHTTDTSSYYLMQRAH